MKINEDNCRKIVTNELFIKSKMKKALKIREGKKYTQNISK